MEAALEAVNAHVNASVSAARKDSEGASDRLSQMGQSVSALHDQVVEVADEVQGVRETLTLGKGPGGGREGERGLGGRGADTHVPLGSEDVSRCVRNGYSSALTNTAADRD